jgi:hypothetical protein
MPVVNAGPATTLSAIFNSIKTARGGSGRIDTLFILCPGYAGTNDRARVCMDAGGMGLQLGAETVLHTNVSRWEAIAGICRKIVAYACAAANTEAGNEGSSADGKYLMLALAIHIGATVYAVDRIQWYDPAKMDFGDWEGNLWAFTASGAPATVARSAPIEISALL